MNSLVPAMSKLLLEKMSETDAARDVKRNPGTVRDYAQELRYSSALIVERQVTRALLEALIKEKETL